MDLDPHILQLEPPILYHYLLGWCVYWPLTKSSRLVAYLSLLSFTINTIFLITSGGYTPIHLVIEVLTLLVEFGCIVCLFYGLAHKKSSFLKPYLVFGVIWNALLFILLLFCVIQLFDRRGFYFDVLLNISEFVHIHVDVDVENFEATSFWLSITLIIGLGVTIAIGCWFLHIILSTYYYFIYRRKAIWDQQPEKKHLIVAELSEKEENLINKEFRL